MYFYTEHLGVIQRSDDRCENNVIQMTRLNCLSLPIVKKASQNPKSRKVFYASASQSSAILKSSL